MLATLHPGSEYKTMNAVQNGAVHSGQIVSPLLVKTVPQGMPRGSVFQEILYLIKLTLRLMLRFFLLLPMYYSSSISFIVKPSLTHPAKVDLFFLYEAR